MTTEQTLLLAGTAVTVTTFLVTGADWLVRKWLQKHRDELLLNQNEKIHDLHDEVANLTQERDHANARLTAAQADLHKRNGDLAAAQAAHEQEKERAEELATELEKANSAIKGHDQTRNAHAARIKAALKLKGALWTQPTMAGAPKFVELPERRTPIVSVLNLKGGVGKTTLTAYLARALAARGYRVLLVDLDLQGSLSSMFIPGLELARLAKAGGRFLSDLLSPEPGAKPAPLLDHTLPCAALGPHARLLPTTDRLAYAELSQTVRWLLRVGGEGRKWDGRHDGRMILRKALHRKTQYRPFDVVLMDCPPIINLCCANALAASDYVLTPITPSQKMIERVPPLLQRVLEVRREVNEHLNMLGLVVNNTRQTDLTAPERDLLLTLPEQCLTVYKSDVYQFKKTIPGRVAIRDRGHEFSAAEPDGEISKAFDALAEEFLQRLPGCCRRPDERTRKPKTVEGV